MIAKFQSPNSKISEDLLDNAIKSLEAIIRSVLDSDDRSRFLTIRSFCEHANYLEMQRAKRVEDYDGKQPPQYIAGNHGIHEYIGAPGYDMPVLMDANIGIDYGGQDAQRQMVMAVMPLLEKFADGQQSLARRNSAGELASLEDTRKTMVDNGRDTAIIDNRIAKLLEEFKAQDAVVNNRSDNNNGSEQRNLVVHPVVARRHPPGVVGEDGDAPIVGEVDADGGSSSVPASSSSTEERVDDGRIVP